MTDDGYIKFKCHLIPANPLLEIRLHDLEEWREKLYELKLIGAKPDRVGYGNISKRISFGSEEFIISGTATGNIPHLNQHHFAVVTKVDIQSNELWCKGEVKASSESMTHAAVYACSEEIGAAIHVHDITMWEHYFDTLPTTSVDATYGTPEMAKEVLRLYKESELPTKKIFVMGGHKEGLIAFGKDLEEAGKVLLEHFESVPR